MSDSTRGTLRFCFRLLAWLSAVIPESLADDWREEWETELLCQRESLTARGLGSERISVRLLRSLLGALPDACSLSRSLWSFDMIIQDLKYTLRQWIRKPGFVVVAALTLAIGIGAGTAIFSVVNAILLRPLPFKEPDRLAALWEKNPEKGWDRQTAAPANFLDWQKESKSFASMAAYNWSDHDVTLSGGGEAEVVRVRPVSGGFFDVLGVPPLLGRAFLPAETWAGGDTVAVLSYGLWTRRFGGDPSIVGKKITVDGQVGEVVGIMPKGFHFPEDTTEMWTPFAWDPAFRDQVWFRRAHFVRVFGRLRDGTSLGRAVEELNLIASDLESRYPETNRLMGNGATDLHEWIVGDTRPALLALFGTVGFLLLIACGNVAHLQLARSALRTREIAVRNALGASRWRLLRQLMTESLALSLVGGAGGLVIALWGVRFLVALSPPELPRVGEVGLDGAVLVFAALVTLATTLIFGLAPALQRIREETVDELRGARTVGGAARANTTRAILVIGEVALALTVIVGAGLFLKSLFELSRVDLGFPKEGLFTFSVSLPDAGYEKPESRIAYFDELMTRLESIPQVQSAAMVSVLPVTGASWTSDYSIEGRPPGQYGIEVRHRRVYPGYFQTVGTPLLKGREFSRADRGDAPRVVLINQALARSAFQKDEDPLGKRICFEREPSSESVWRTIVGVVGDSRQAGVAEDPRPEVYQPWLQEPQSGMDVVLRSAGGITPGLIQEARRILSEVDPQIPFYKARTMDEIVSGSIARERFMAILLVVFAAVGLILASVGIYGVTTYTVTQRVPEIGIRMALGARAGDILSMVMRRGAGQILLGLGFGLVMSLLLARFVSGLLFQVSPSDPATFAAVSCLLTAVALLACFLPARRASRVDPIQSLRAD